MGVPAHVPAELVHQFDIAFKGPLDDLFPRLDALRDKGRVLWLNTSLGASQGGGEGGVWFFTQAEDIRHGLQDTDLFGQSFDETGGVPSMIPIGFDPPEHTKYRRILTPLFAPSVVEKMEESILGRIVHLIDDVIDKGHCDFTNEIALEFPTRVFTSWMGLPEDETPRFAALVSTLIHGVEGTGTGDSGNAMVDAAAALNDLITARVAEPTTDLMSQIVVQQVDDRPLTHEELMSIAYLLFVAGLDTVAAALSFSYWHLAQTPDDRKAIATGSTPPATAVEELLRRHSFVNLPRMVRHDGEFAGVQVKAGDLVIMSTPMASRDPDEFADPSQIHLDRDSNRHYAFGAGPHRCVGSHLARIEMRVALEEWHKRIPDYRLDGDVIAYGGTVMGVHTLPLRWD
jgi:cytochrome P450